MLRTEIRDERGAEILRGICSENLRFSTDLKLAEDALAARHAVSAYVRALIRDDADLRRGHRAAGFSRLDAGNANWRGIAARRLLHYVENAGLTLRDQNLRGRAVALDPIATLWSALRGQDHKATPAFLEDWLHLLRQLRGAEAPARPRPETLERWMQRHLSGLDAGMATLRSANKERILGVILDRMERGLGKEGGRYVLPASANREQKLARLREWWGDWRFHLSHAVRDPETLNEMLAGSLDAATMATLREGYAKGIPVFVNPYYLSLYNVDAPDFAATADRAIRSYIIYTQDLVDEFGHIVAWEKEDCVQVGRPNAAGWLLPSSHAVHRRYPEVAILIPQTMGRACGGLCSTCQRMYDFQSGNLNFDLEALRPGERWPARLERYLRYFEEDSQLRDVLITGGDALMNTDKSLTRILSAVLAMAARKREANRARPRGEKYAEIVRVRMGTRLPAYLPQRVTPALARALAAFKARASRIGVTQFVIQTHFQSPAEVTPDSRAAVRLLQGAGWMVTNQTVFTVDASTRGHAAALRRVLGEIGVLPYYTFAVKGFAENRNGFVPNGRLVQEAQEEKAEGRLSQARARHLADATARAGRLPEVVAALRADEDLPFLATDRSVMNLPGVGKSLTFQVIGLTDDGRRVLAFEHDPHRAHSPIVNHDRRTVIIESKSLSDYIVQLGKMGERAEDYAATWGYSEGQTEERLAPYEYPATSDDFTTLVTNLASDDEAIAAS